LFGIVLVSIETKKHKKYHIQRFTVFRHAAGT
jgi:hypothetical protein